MVLVLGFWTFLRAVFFGSAAVALENVALRGYIGYYNTARPHQSLDNNSPQPRVVEPSPRGRIIAIPQVGGLHHRYQRVA
jgi:hypothetical protein